MDHITFYFENAESDVSTSTKGFLSTPKNLLKDEKFVDIPQDMLTKNIQQTVAKIGDIFNSDDSTKKTFEIDEIEFSLNIGTDGKVSIIAAEVATSMSTSIRIKLKRKQHEEEQH